MKYIGECSVDNNVELPSTFNEIIAFIVPEGSSEAMAIFTIPQIVFDYIPINGYKRLFNGGYGNASTNYFMAQVLIYTNSIRYNSAFSANVTSNSGKMYVYYH